MTPRPISRRSLLAAAATTPLLGGCGRGTGRQATRQAARGAAVRRHRVSYGDHPSQFADLYRPSGSTSRGTSKGTIVVIHGGFWLASYGLDLGAPLCQDLAGRGFTCWNLEYRRVGGDGGWPATFADAAAGVDHLDRLDVDTDRVVTLGHSAGGQLAVWLATRDASTPGGAPRVPVRAAVSQAGVLAMATASRQGVGGGAEDSVVGGSPAQVPGRYAAVDPVERLPAGVPVRCVHGDADQTVPISQSRAYVDAARDAGDDAALHVVRGASHLSLIDVDGPAWPPAQRLVTRLAQG